ncbi:uncharacterized protein LOC114359454 [Ostrinia furnacalis]|uniref:uncharacterized protein LOC114359454 n=1 Tax=Ostrinia furnacalis TaxID=93504 RepID=UPI00103CD68C|nr:uncharacterized protein LOC114359454 [Ostrinia furnacalis]
MLQLLVLACVLALGVAEPELEPAAAASPVFVQRDEHERFDRGHDDDPHHQRKAHISDDILRKQHKIIESVYSPDYSEPTVVLDYRYLKSGGRDYVRGPGGQILILPHNVKSPEHNEHKDYDSLIEFLRLKNLAMQGAVHQRQEELNHGHQGPQHGARHGLHLNYAREDSWH